MTKTTLRITTGTFRKAKVHAVMEGTTLQDVVEQALHEFLERQKKTGRRK